MTSIAEPGADLKRLKRIRTIDHVGLAITIGTVILAILWAFPLYWSLVTSITPENDVVARGFRLWPERPTLDAYVAIFEQSKIVLWYANSLVTSGIITIVVIASSAACAYALSQLRFPGRKLLWLLILASFMVPTQALIITHFVLISQFKLLNSWAGVILPQLISPVVIIVYKQFFDSVPREIREAAQMDSTNEFRMLFRIYLPMNWGVTAALGIITFIWSWNAFLWPFLAVVSEDKMNVTVGITQVTSAWGVQYARELASAVMAGLPVAIVYLIFQRRVTEALMLSAGIKG